MNILVIGSGGREHALAWKLAQSKNADKVYAAPGNGGTALEGGKIENVPIKEMDFSALLHFAEDKKIGLTVVGPEVPLAAGIVDVFQKQGFRIFGPSKAAAQLEASKIFCKEILRKGNIPTAIHRTFSDGYDAANYLKQGEYIPSVVKADGLAAGKGVFVCRTREEALDAVRIITEEKEFGDAGDRLLIEEMLDGEEASVLAITDGSTILTLQPAQDHKAAFDGDKGPNTGGMGAYCPAPVVDTKTLHWIEERVLVPTVHALNQNGTPFKGVLYAGLMITRQGPKVLEYNVRFGDPECQPLMMRLKTDLVDICNAAIDGQLSKIGSLEWDDRTAVCVVMAGEGYPGKYAKGFPIQGLEEAAEVPKTKVFHAGTLLDVNGRILTSGGRVLGVTGLGETVSEAKTAAYSAVKHIRWNGSWYRKDISDKALR
ncbi:MAG: phosphoribosylamine--glycine ligase [Planctomycetaceae bacterium]|nr:phosphoribosylamine--glycine ligase [Planctomycetaceae bacterium]